MSERGVESAGVPAGWVRVAFSQEIEEGRGKLVETEGLKLGIFRLSGKLYCIDDTCTHEEESLSEGELIPEECAVECPRHGSLFSLETGEALTLPATVPVKTYGIREADGQVFVDLGDRRGRS